MRQSDVHSDDVHDDVTVAGDGQFQRALSLLLDVLDDQVPHATHIGRQTRDLERRLVGFGRLDRRLSGQLQVANRLTVAANDQTDQKRRHR